MDSIGEQTAIDHVRSAIQREPEVEQRETGLARNLANVVIDL
jgi:hypothetical protein